MIDCDCDYLFGRLLDFFGGVQDIIMVIELAITEACLFKDYVCVQMLAAN
jgi:hypothetical protein